MGSEAYCHTHRILVLIRAIMGIGSTRATPRMLRRKMIVMMPIITVVMTTVGVNYGVISKLE